MAQKEGWSKAEKLKNRHTTQGTLVFCHDRTKHQAAIIEVLFQYELRELNYPM
jgi:translation elongation factor EF-Ts